MLRHTFRSPLRAVYGKKIAILQEKFTEITRFGGKKYIPGCKRYSYTRSRDLCRTSKYMLYCELAVKLGIGSKTISLRYNLTGLYSKLFRRIVS